MGRVARLSMAAGDAAEEDVVAQEGRQRRVRRELVVQRQGGHLGLRQPGAVAHVGRGIGVVLGGGQLLQMEEGTTWWWPAWGRCDGEGMSIAVWAKWSQACGCGSAEGRRRCGSAAGCGRQLGGSFEVADVLLLTLREIVEAVGRRQPRQCRRDGLGRRMAVAACLWAATKTRWLRSARKAEQWALLVAYRRSISSGTSSTDSATAEAVAGEHDEPRAGGAHGVGHVERVAGGTGRPRTSCRRRHRGCVR